MNGAILKHLAEVANLARLDIEAAGVTLEAKQGLLTAGYTGQYARGYREMPIPEDMSFRVNVSASRFKTIVGMFSDEDDVEIAVLEHGLRIKTKQPGVNAILNHWGEPQDFAELDKKKLEWVARMPTQDLISELEAASAFVADTQARPAFAGINIAFGDTLQFMAHDGGGALFQSHVQARMRGVGSITVPTQDFLLGARLIATQDVIIAKPRGADHIALYNQWGLFRSSTIAVPYPDVSSITKRLKGSSFQVESGMIRNLVASAKALDAGPDISVAPRGGRVYFGFKSESGSFVVSTKGDIPTALHYDAETLDKVTKLGPVLKFTVPAKPTQPTLVESDHRKCWVVTRI